MAARSSPPDVQAARWGAAPTLRSRQDLARVEANGRTRADRLIVVRFVPNALDHDRFGIATGRHLGGAVKRNRVRRRIREILRQRAPDGGPGRDILIVARSASVGATFNELKEALEGLLRSLRVGQLKAPS